MIASLKNEDARLADRKARLNSISEALKSKEAAAADQQTKLLKSQESVSDKLVWALYGMVFVLGAVLYFLLKIGGTNDVVAKMLIEERMLIEVLSMGFLLLTVIILGSAEKIQGQALGALLGTVAGYIFGTKAADRKVQQIQSAANELRDAAATSRAANAGNAGNAGQG